MKIDSINTLPVMEQFLTLQGEGRFTGHPAYFIRLGGCDVGCVWCDVKESWEIDKHPRIAISELVKKVVESGTKIAVITGGEPCMHDLTSLTTALQQHGIRTHVETSGAHPITGTWDWVTLSPKKFKSPLEASIQHANELKVVVYHKSDFEWAEQYADQVSTDCLLYLQPEWSKVNEMNVLIIEYIKKKPTWALSLQTHKFLNIP